MSGWGNGVHGWQRIRRRDPAGVPATNGRWTTPDFAATIVGFAVHWELGVAFLVLKLWQQASGYPGSVFAFAREKWDGLVSVARSLLSGAAVPSLHLGGRSSGNHAFDAWRRAELARIDTERGRLRDAEREFATYRDELLHAKDRDDFDRFMQGHDKRS